MTPLVIGGIAGTLVAFATFGACYLAGRRGGWW